MEHVRGAAQGAQTAECGVRNILLFVTDATLFGEAIFPGIPLGSLTASMLSPHKFDVAGYLSLQAIGQLACWRSCLLAQRPTRLGRASEGS